MKNLLTNDKVLHFAVGFVLALCVATIVKSPLHGLGAAVLVGALKELWDRYSGTGNPEWADFAATVAGGAFGGMVALGVLTRTFPL